MKLVRHAQNDTFASLEARSGNVAPRCLNRIPRAGIRKHPHLVLSGIASRPHRRGTSHSHPVSVQNSRDWADVAGTTNREAKIVPAVAIASGNPDAAPGAH